MADGRPAAAGSHRLKKMASVFRCLVISAGIIGAITGPVSAEQQQWSVGPPLLRVGADVELHDVRSVFLQDVRSVFLRDSILYVAEKVQIRAFHHRSGELLYTAGREGQGPGEFQSLRWLSDCKTDDRIFAGDRYRVVVYSPQLEHLRTITLALQSGNARYTGMFCVGPEVLLALSRTFDFERPSGAYRLTQRLLKHSLSDGHYQGVVGEPFLGDERWRWSGDGPLTFGKRALAAAFSDGFVLGTADGPWLTRYTLDGVVTDTIHLSGVSSYPVLPETIRQRHERSLEAARRRGPDFEAARRRHLSIYPYPSHYPPYLNLFLSKDARLWIQLYPAPQGPSTLQWLIVTDSGVSATLAAPHDFAIKWADGEYVAGVATDDLGVEYVELREIISPEEVRQGL